MKQALLTIDFIKGICETGSCADYLRAKPAIIDNVNRLSRSFRDRGDPVIHIRLAFDPTYQALPKYAPTGTFLKENKKYLEGTPETEFISGLDIVESDIIVDKKYGDPFHGNDLAALLRERGVEGIVLTGFATDNAILYGAASAITGDFHVTVITDACGAPTEEAHVAALSIMKNRVVNVLCTSDAYLRKD